MSGITYSVNDADKVLQKYGISLVDSQGKMRDLSDVLNDLGTQWDKMSRLEQNQLAYVIAGTRQRNIFTAAMADYNRVLDATEVSVTAVGTAEQKMEVYTQSLEAAQNRLTAAIQTFAQDTNIDQILITLTNGLTKIIELLDLVLNRIPIVSQALKGLIAVAAINAVSAGISTLIARFGGLSTVVNLVTGAIPSLMTGLVGVTDALFGAQSAVSLLVTAIGTASFPAIVAGFVAVSTAIFGIGKAVEYFKSQTPEEKLQSAQEAAASANTELTETKEKIADIKATLDGIEDGTLELTNPEDKERLEEQLQTLTDIKKLQEQIVQEAATQERTAQDTLLKEKYSGSPSDIRANVSEQKELFDTFGLGYVDFSGADIQTAAAAYEYLQEQEKKALQDKRLLTQAEQEAMQSSRQALQSLLQTRLADKKVAEENHLINTDYYKTIVSEVEFLKEKLGLVEIQATKTDKALAMPTSNQALSEWLGDFTSKQSAIGQQVSALSDAYKDMSDSGQLNVETIQQLLSLYPELINDMETENGVTTISVQKIGDLFEAIKNQKLAAIDAEIANTQAVIDETRKRIKAYEAEIEAKGAIQPDTRKERQLAAAYKELSEAEDSLTSSQKERAIVAGLSLQSMTKASKNAASSMKKDISSVKSATEKLLDLTLAMLKKEYEQQKKNLQDQKDSLDKQQEAFENKIKTQQKFLDLQEQETKHAKELEEKNKAIANIQEQLLELQYDTSAEGQRKQLELLDNLSDANKDLTDYQSDYALDQQKQSLSDQLDNYKEYIDNLKDGIDEQIKYIDEVRLNETNLYMEAIGLIEGRSGEFYNRLVEYNKTYGDHTVETVNQAWMVAYTALDTYGGSYKEFLDTINSQMLIINDNTKTTTDTANKLADAYERAARAYQTFATNGSGNAYKYYLEQTGGPLILHDGAEFVKKNNSWLDKMLGLGSNETAAILKVGEAVIPDYANNIASIKTSSNSSLFKTRPVNYSTNNTNVGSTFNIDIPINIAGNATEDVVQSLKAVSNDIANNVFKRINEITAMSGYKNIARATT